MNAPSRSKSLKSLLLGGVLPLVVYTLVEEYYGVVWGLVAGMALGVAEVISEKVKLGRVDVITWVGNGMILVLGTISLLTHEGVWFKMQPAIIEVFMGVFLIGSVIAGKPFLVLMAKRQGMLPETAPENPVVYHYLIKSFSGFTVRVGIFFLIHAVIAAYAALYWSTRAWVILKGVGFTGSFLLYGLIEVWLMRRRLRPRAQIQS